MQILLGASRIISGQRISILRQGILTLFEPGYENYPFEPGGGAKLPHTLKNAYISMKLTQNEAINIKF